MTTFEIADCPVRLDMVEGHKGTDRIQKGTLTLTVRSKSERAESARIAIQPQSPAKPEWFSFPDAPSTSPREIERDFQARATETIKIDVTVPGNVSPGAHMFNAMITAEERPDDDFVVSPNVAFNVAAWTQAPPPREKFPWWAIAIAAALVLLVGGAGLYLLLAEDDKQVPRLISLTLPDALQRLQEQDLRSVTIRVSAATLPADRFGNRVIATGTDECDPIGANDRLELYVAAAGGEASVKALETFDPETKSMLEEGIALTSRRLTRRPIDWRDRFTARRASQPSPSYIRYLRWRRAPIPSCAS